MATRKKLLDTLKQLGTDEFEAVLFQLPVDRSYLPGPIASRTTKAISVLELLEQQGKMEKLASLLANSEALRRLQPYGLEIEENVKRVLNEYGQQPFAERSPQQARITDFVNQPAGGVLVVTAEAGFGKSALLINWQQQHQKDYFIVFHCFRAGSEVMRSRTNGYRHLLRQLSFYASRPDQNFPIDESGMRDSLFSILSSEPESELSELKDNLSKSRSAKPCQLVIILDGLDEADGLFEPFWPTPLPAGVKVIVSARAAENDRPDYLKRWIEPAQRLHLKRLPRAAIRNWVTKIGPLQPYASDDFIQKLDERTDGFPIYLRFLLDDLRQAAPNPQKVKDLLTSSPAGFTAYVQEQFQLLAKTEGIRQANIQALFVLLTVALGELSESDIQSLTKLSAFDLMALPWKVTRWFSIRSRAYSFAHLLLAQAFKGFLGQQAIDAERKLLGYCEQWPSHHSLYALRCYADHLKAANQHQDLYALARDQAFSVQQQQYLTDEPEALLNAARLALQNKADADDAAGMAEFLLLHACRWLQMTRESPLDAIKAGNLEKAWKLADQFDGERCVLWYLLLAWALSTQANVESAAQVRATLSRLSQKQPPQLDYGQEANIAICLLTQLLPSIDPIPTDLLEQVLSSHCLWQLCKNLNGQGAFSTSLQLLPALIAEHRVGTLAEIIIGFVQTQELETALELSEQLDDLLCDDPLYRHKRRAFRELSVALAKAQRIEAAIATDNRNNFELGEEQIRSIATTAQIETQQFDAAIQTAQLIQDPWTQNQLLQQIAIQQANNQLFDAAIASANLIDDSPSMRRQVLRIIAAAQSAAMKFRSAAKTITLIDVQPGEPLSIGEILVQEKIDTFRGGALSHQAYYKATALGETLVSLAKAEPLQPVSDIAQLIAHPFYQSFVLKAIALHKAETGSFQTAMETATLIEDPAIKTATFSQIAVARIQSGESAIEDFERVTEVVTLIEKPIDKVWALEAIAGISIGNNILITFEEIEETALHISDVRQRAWTLLLLAEKQAELNKRESHGLTLKAIEAARLIAIPSWKVQALIAIAKTQSSVNEAAAHETLTEALWATHLVQSLYDKEECFKEIAIAQLSIQQFAVAIQIAQLIETPLKQKELLTLIVESQLQAQQFSAAIETIHMMEHSPARRQALHDVVLAQARAQQIEAAVATAALMNNRDKNAALIQAMEEQIQAQQFQTALKIAASTENSWAREEALVTMAVSQAKARQIKAAIKTSQLIEPPRKGTTLQAIATVQIQHNQVQETLAIAQQMGVPQVTFEMLIAFVAAHAQAQQFDAAFELAGQLDRQAIKAQAFHEIAVGQMQAQQFHSAVDTAMRIEDLALKRKLLQTIAVDQVRWQQTEAAQYTIETAIETETSADSLKGKEQAMGAIALSQAKAKQFEQARATIQLMAEPRFIATALGKIAAVEQRELATVEQAGAQPNELTSSTLLSAIDVATKAIKNPLFQVQTLIVIARDQARSEISELTEAISVSIEAAQQIATSQDLAKLQFWLTETQVHMQQFETANRTAKQIDLPVHRAEALGKIAVAQAQAKADGEAQQTFAAAISDTLQIKNTFRKSEALEAIAKAQARAGYFEEALETADQIDAEDLSRDFAFETIANEQALDHQFEAAFKTVMEIESSTGQGWALGSIAVAYARAGQFEAALKVAKDNDTLFSYSRTSSVHAGIASAMAAAGLEEDAIAETAKIMSDRSDHLADIALRFVQSNCPSGFKQLLIPCANELNAAYRMCSYLAGLYPEQSIEIVNVVNNFRAAPLVYPSPSKVSG